MDWDLIRSAVIAAADGFFQPYGLLALVGFAVVGLIVAALLPNPPSRGPELRCADEIAEARRRAEERRRDGAFRDASRRADLRVR